MGYTVIVSDDAKKKLKKLDHQIQRAALKVFERIQARDDPRSMGHGLHGALANYWTYVVFGDWRAIAHIQDKTITVLIVDLDARDSIYK